MDAIKVGDEAEAAGAGLGDSQGPGVLTAGRGRPRVPGLHGGGPLRGVAGSPSRGPAAGPGPGQPAFGQSHVTPRHGTRRPRAAPGALLLQRVGRGIRRHLHGERQPGAETRGGVVSLRPRHAFLLTFDNHNSVNGIREFARAHHAADRYVPVSPPDLRVDRRLLEELDARGDGERRGSSPIPPSPTSPACSTRSLDRRGAGAGLGRPARRGRVRPHQPPGPRHLAARLRRPVFLQDVRLPHRRRRVDRPPAGASPLQRPWFAGGTITVASVGADGHQLAHGVEAFEDGTLNFACLPASSGLDFLEQRGDRRGAPARPAASPDC